MRFIFFLALFAPLSGDYMHNNAGSAVTETVCALGDCDKIFATDRTSLFPSQVQQLPSFGFRSSINAEGNISLKPSLVITEKDYVEEENLRTIIS